ncbi:MAG: rhodanese-related sulfurtransferase [Candidatus Dependentiae bacterium]|nr:rhodanese-related sulfurtransferase [Candidatus Dependentiae bacterium]
MGTLILFYKYVDIQYPKQILKWQTQICQDLGLKGRIILAHEGINGTLAGDNTMVERYITLMNNHELFGAIDFKKSEGDSDYFPRLRIVIKDEIVNFGQDTQKVTVRDGGRHLTPAQAHALLQDKPENLVILDTRNNYESRIGTFTDAIIPDIKNFRDLPEYLDINAEQFKDKKVLMFCTGGVRCERATAYLNQKGIAQEVYQVEGGIVRYTEQFPDGYFRGKNYVFDSRVAVKINDDILSICDLCSNASDDYTNCLNATCNKHFIACQDCVTQYHNTCSKECSELVTNKKVAVRAPFKKAEPQTACSVQ